MTDMSSTDQSPRASAVRLSVGEVALHLGVPASTLRTWERRYGLAPSARRAGGHRRYDEGDVALLEHMQQLINPGVSAAEAARAVHRVSSAPAADASTLPDAIVEAARTYDVIALRELFTRSIQEHGVATAWTAEIAPTLRRVGDEWFSGGLGVDGEHLVSDSILTVLRSTFATSAVKPVAHRGVVLASAEDDQHSLPLLALQAALAEEGVSCHLLGARVPATALAGMIIRVDPAAVFLWASIQRPANDQLSRVIAAASSRAAVLVGGPGWSGVDLGPATWCQDLEGALAAVHASLADGSPTS